MNTLILCRHGEVHNPQKVFYGRTLDIPLSESGKTQIESIAKKIKALSLLLSKIYSSPLRRAMQTSEILSKNLKVSVIPNNDIMDVDIPALIGKSLVLRQEIHEKGTDEYTGEWVKKGNESKEQIMKRMLKTCHNVTLKNKNRVPILVSHGDPISILYYALKNPGKVLPPIFEILKNGYLVNKGCGMILDFDDKGILTKETPLIS